MGSCGRRWVSGKITFPLRTSLRPALIGNFRTRSKTTGEPFSSRSVNTSPVFVTCAMKIRRSTTCPLAWVGSAAGAGLRNIGGNRMRYWKGSIALSPTQDFPLLQQVLRSNFVTHRQLYDLLTLDYHATSRNAFNNRVRRLVKHQYLVRDEIALRRDGYVYSISDIGASELIGLGEYYTGPTRRPKDGQVPRGVYHALELNQIHLALKRSQQLVRWMYDTEIH